MNLRYLLILLNEYPTVVSKWVKYTGSLVRKCQDQKNNQSSILLIINLKLKLTLLLLNVIEIEKISSFTLVYTGWTWAMANTCTLPVFIILFSC